MAYRILDDCLNCGACLDDVCPENAIIEGDTQSTIDPAKCTDCGYCVEEFSCPAFAIVKG